MRQTHDTARRRRVTALVGGIAAATALASSAIGSVGPAASAPPTGDCAAPYPVTALTTGQLVNGRTVQAGTTPQPFTGEVLGVVEDGIAPDLDMIIARLTSPEIDRVGGIWQGMSGSPVYAADGRLIGAVSYGLAFGSSPVAGITPFDDMNNYPAARSAAARIRITKGQARRVAEAAGITRHQATQGFSQLRIPYGISGIGASRLATLPDRPYRDRDLAAGSATVDAAGPGAETMIAGGNVAAAVAYGDLTQGGVGTVTSVCGTRVYAFGHPLAFFGRTTLSLHPASAIYVQEDPVGPAFKVANFGPRVGTVTDDRLAGISGTFDAYTPTTAVTSGLTYNGRGRNGRTDVAVPIATADTTLLQIVANHDRLVDGIIKGSELQSWNISGKKPDGTAFSLIRTDRYAGPDIAFTVPFDVADAVYLLGSYEGVTIDSVIVSGAVSDDARMWTLDHVRVKVGKKYKKVKPNGRIDARAGKALKLRAVLTGPAGRRLVPLKVKVPTRSLGFAFLSVAGGNDYFNEGEFIAEEGGFGPMPTLNEYLASQRSAVRNDEVAADLFIETKRSVKVKQADSAPQDRVVSGFFEYRVRIR